MPRLTIKNDNERSLHFLTLVILDHVEVFVKEKYFQIILDCLNFCRKNLGLLLYEFVIMKDHLHLIIAAKSGYELSKIVCSFKKFTTKEILYSLREDDPFIYNEIINSEKKKFEISCQLWRHGNWPKAIMTQEFLAQKITYIHQNPVKKGYVEKPEDWKYSSAKNRILGDNSTLDVDSYSL